MRTAGWFKTQEMESETRVETIGWREFGAEQNAQQQTHDVDRASSSHADPLTQTKSTAAGHSRWAAVE